MTISSAERKFVVQEGREERENVQAHMVWMCEDTMSVHSFLVLVPQGSGGTLLIRTVTLDKGSG